MSRTILLLCAVCAAACPVTASADITNDILGSWRAVLSVNVGGNKQKTPGTLRVRKQPDGTLLFVQRGSGRRLGSKWYLFPDQTLRIEFYDNGRFDGEGAGTWRVEGQKIIVAARVSVLDSEADYNCSLVRLSRNKWGLLATTSLGTRQTGTFRRLR